MRGRMTAVTAESLTAELRKRLAETTNTTGDTPTQLNTEQGCRLGSKALRLAHIATALHMAAAAKHTGARSSTP